LENKFFESINIMRELLVMLLLLVFTCSSVIVYAQKQGTARVDSLLAELPNMQDDTTKVRLLADITMGYLEISYDTCIAYGVATLALAKKIGWKYGEGLANQSLGYPYTYMGDYPTSLDYMLKAVKIYEELGAKRELAMIDGDIGVIYHSLKNYPKALEAFNKTLKITEEMGTRDIYMLGALNNIGDTYVVLGNYKRAMYYFTKGLNIAKELNFRLQQGTFLGNIGYAYNEMKEYPTALAYQYEALSIMMEVNDKGFVAFNYGKIGQAYLKIAKTWPHIAPDSLIPARKEATISKAIEYLEKGIATGRDANANADLLQMYQDISEAYALTGNYKAALEAYRHFKNVNDSIFSIENTTRISNLETNRILQLKDKDLKIARLSVAKKRNERLGFTAGILLLLGIMAMLFRNNKKQQRTNYLLGKEKKRSDDLLLNILPAEVAEELKENGKSVAKQYEAVSVLFTDFVDFTGGAEQLGPQALVEELNECFTIFDSIIDRNGLEKIKTIGDAYMAVCGLPVGDKLHAHRTVQAALEIRDFIVERNKEYARRSFRIRIGINSGPVVAGIVGVKKFAFDIWGDTVNTAARMEQRGEEGQSIFRKVLTTWCNRNLCALHAEK
jgi:adenylate cyclase